MHPPLAAKAAIFAREPGFPKGLILSDVEGRAPCDQCHKPASALRRRSGWAL